MIRSCIPLMFAVALVACASAPTYTPAASANGAGYSERQIEADRFYVLYRAGGTADAALLQDFALLRAADIALEHGGDWFWVDRRALDEDPYQANGPRLGVSLGGASFGGHSGVGLGVGMSFPLGHQAQQAHSATVEMRLGHGPKPDDPSAFDAHATDAAIRARLMTTPPR